MAHIYRVNYTTTDHQSAAAIVSATTAANAVSTATSNDSKFKDLIAVQQVSMNHLAGS